MVTMENYEEYMMLQADGELDEAVTEALQAFLDKHPELAGEMDVFASLRLEPDTTVVYPGREELLKPVPVKRTIVLGRRSMAAAAGVAAVVCIAAWQYLRPGNGTGSDSGAIAGIITPKITVTIPQTKPAAITADTQTQPAPQPSIPASHIAAAHRNPAQPRHQATAPVQQQDVLAALQPLDAQALPTGTIAPGRLPAATPEVPSPATKEEKQNKRFLAWLPLPEEKKQGLEMVKTAIEQRIEQVRTLNNNIKETTLVLNIGQKGITLNL